MAWALGWRIWSRVAVVTGPVPLCCGHVNGSASGLPPSSRNWKRAVVADVARLIASMVKFQAFPERTCGNDDNCLMSTETALEVLSIKSRSPSASGAGVNLAESECDPAAMLVMSRVATPPATGTEPIKTSPSRKWTDPMTFTPACAAWTCAENAIGWRDTKLSVALGEVSAIDVASGLTAKVRGALVGFAKLRFPAYVTVMV